MKFYWLLVLSVFYITSSVAAQTVTLGYVNFPPYEYQSEGEASGILVDIVKEVFKKAATPLELKYLPFKRAYKETLEGKIDGLFNFYKNEERLKLFDYTDRVIVNPLVLFVRKESQLQFNDLNDLMGIKVGVLRGYTYGTEFDNSKITKEAVNSHDTNFKKLVMGRIEAYPVDKMVGIYVARQNNVMQELKILPKTLKTMDGFIGFAKGKQQPLIKKINSILAEMIQKGEVDSIINKYITR